MKDHIWSKFKVYSLFLKLSKIFIILFFGGIKQLVLPDLGEEL